MVEIEVRVKYRPGMLLEGEGIPNRSAAFYSQKAFLHRRYPGLV